MTVPELAPVLDSGQAEHIVAAARVLRDGGVAVVPTDTVYGLSASVLNAGSVERIFAIKRREPESAVPVLLATAADMVLVAREIPRVAWALIDRFWPGPLTIVLPARTGLPRAVTGGGRTVGVRVPAGKSILSLLEAVGEPLVGTSANRHGSPPLVTAASALEELGGEVDVILADDSLGGGLPSTVVEIGEGQVMVHREGAIAPEQIRATLGLRVQIRR